MEYHYLTIPIPKRPWLWVRFRITTLLLLVAIISIVLAWRRDHKKMATELRRLRYPPVAWGAMQVLGPPNTSGPGDIQTAWASAQPDNQEEWLLLEFDKSVTPSAVVIHETYNPGAVYKVTHISWRGTETVLWEGTDPMPQGGGAGLSRLPVTEKIRTGKIKVYIASQNVPGYNEIDAVGLEYGDPKKPQTIWATSIEASSYYGQGIPQPWMSYPQYGNLGGSPTPYLLQTGSPE